MNLSRFYLLKVLLVFSLLFSGLLYIPALVKTSVVQAADYVVTNTNDSGPGSLRAALTAANSGGGAANIDLTTISGTIFLTSNLPQLSVPFNIKGPGANRLTIDGGKNYQLFKLTSATSIEGLTLANAKVAAGPGGALFAQGAQAVFTLTDMIFTGNQAASGGAIFSESGQGLINHCVFITNSAVISSGGAIYNQTQPLAIYNSTFTGNQAATSGGAIYVAGGLITVTNSTLNTNSSGQGGAFWASGEQGTIINSTFSGNLATDRGGGIYQDGNGGAQLYLLNSTISDNAIVNWGAGGIYTPIDSFHTTLKNTIVANNRADHPKPPDIFGSVRSQGHNIIGDANDTNITPTDGDQLGTYTNPIDPKLGPLQNNGGLTPTRALLAGSPALNAIEPAKCSWASGLPLTTDQRGLPRPAGSNCDIGAYEAQSSIVVNSNADSDDGSCDALGTGSGNQDCTLREAINQANQASQAGSNVTTINFSVDSIILNSALPVISNSNGLTITLDAGCSIAAPRAAPNVVLSVNGSVASGLRLGSRVVVHGLRLSNFNDYAVDVLGDNNIISCNWIGQSWGIAGSNGGGIRLGNTNGSIPANNNSIGVLTDRDSGNLISGNNDYGILANGGRTNRLYFNVLGLDRTGNLVPNHSGAVKVKAGGQLKFGIGNLLRN